MSDGVDLLKWDGTHLWNWGIVPPVNAPTLQISAGIPPNVPMISTIAGGTLTGQGTLFVRTTCVTPFGETQASAETFMAVPDDNQLVVAFPTTVPSNVTGWNVYIGHTAGSETLQNVAPIPINVNYTQTTAITLTGAVPPGSSTGSYTITSYLGVSYVYCYYNSETAHVSTASPVSSYTGQQSDVNITLSGSGSTDPQVDTIQIYRTTDGGATYYLLASVANTSSWTYVDTGTPDTSLNALLVAPQALANNPPPAGLQNLAYFAGCIWGSVGNYLYFSNGPLTTNGSGNESWPPLNYALLPSQVTRLVPYPNGMLIFTVDDLYVITAPGATPTIYQAGLGVLSYNAVDISGSTIYAFTSDCNLVQITPGAGILDLGFNIADQFSTWNPANVSISYHIYGHKDSALFVCDGTGDYFRVNPNQQPEGGAVWSPMATIAAGATVIASAETSPGVHKLMVSSGNTIQYRDWTVNTDNNVSYEAWAVIGSLVLAMPGQLCEVESVTIESVRVGTIPSVSVLLGEISGEFDALPKSTNDPPCLLESTTLYSKRFYLNQSGKPIVCRHMQLRVDFNLDTAANELLSYSLYGALHLDQ
jgi:hypothetical protein